MISLAGLPITSTPSALTRRLKIISFSSWCMISSGSHVQIFIRTLPCRLKKLCTPRSASAMKSRSSMFFCSASGQSRSSTLNMRCSIRASRFLAIELASYPRFSTDVMTRRRVCSSTCPRRFRTRDTVAIDTPAASAT